MRLRNFGPLPPLPPDNVSIGWLYMILVKRDTSIIPAMAHRNRRLRGEHTMRRSGSDPCKITFFPSRKRHPPLYTGCCMDLMPTVTVTKIYQNFFTITFSFLHPLNPSIKAGLQTMSDCRKLPQSFPVSESFGRIQSSACFHSFVRAIIIYRGSLRCLRLSERRMGGK